MRKPPLWKQLENLSETFTPKIRAAFLAAIQDVRDRTILQEVVDAVEAGDPVKAFKAMGFTDAAMRPITAIIEQAFETGGIVTAGTFPPLQTDTGLSGAKAAFRFDVRNSRAEAWMRDHSSTLVTRISDDQLMGIRQTMHAGLTAGTNPRTVALDIIGRVDPRTGRRVGGIVGLSQPQEKWVRNARAELSDPAMASNYLSRARRDKRFDSVVRKSIATNTPLDAPTVQKLVGRYSDSLLQLRGETIARTEMLTSLGQAQDEAFAQVVDTGAVPASAVTSKWDATGDARTRPDHMAMNGQTVAQGQAFVAPDGSRMMFPGDTSLGADPSQTINCRCKKVINVDWLAGAAG